MTNIITVEIGDSRELNHHRLEAGGFGLAAKAA